MNEKRIKSIGILAAFIMISTTFTAVTVPAFVLVEWPIGGDPVYSLDMKVWNPETSTWVDSLHTDVGAILRYNITIEYLNDNSLYNIRIVDALPACLQYVEGSATFVNSYNQRPNETIAGNIIYWNFTNSHQLVLDNDKPYLFIEFEAQVIYCDKAVNTVTVNAMESGIELPTATTSVEVQINSLRFLKQVRNKGETWYDEITAIGGDVIAFRFAVDYYGVYNVTNMTITDHLPSGLVYSGLNLLNQNISVSENKTIVWVNFTDVILNNTKPSINITFLVNVTASEPQLIINAAELGYNETTHDKPLFYRTDSALITIISNSPPNVPNKPSGERFNQLGWGLINTPYDFNTSSIDPNGDKIQYGWDWDDGTSVEWSGFFNSGANAIASHAWTTAGIKNIKVKARDIRGTENVTWSNVFSVWILSEEPNTHHYPPLTPHKPDCNSTGKIEENINFTTNSTDPDGTGIRYVWDWNDSSPLQWVPETSYIPSGQNCTVSHIFTSAGIYNVKVKAVDIDWEESGWSATASITITSDNNPPSIPVLSGSSEGAVNKSYSFTAVSADPEGDHISYYFDWGDGTSSGWTTSYASGATVSVSHSWNATGSYNIKVKAKDEHGLEGGWSSVKTITISASADLTITGITGGLSVKATIKNDGSLVANNINWSITVKGSRLLSKINVAVNGTIDSLAVGSDIVVKTSLVKGFGKVSIKVSVDGVSIASTSKTVDGFVFGFFVIVAK